MLVGRVSKIEDKHLVAMVASLPHRGAVISSVAPYSSLYLTMTYIAHKHVKKLKPANTRNTYICTYEHLYINKYILTRKNIHTCIHAYMHTNIHTYIMYAIHTYIHTYIHHTQIHAHMQTIYAHTCMHACMHAIHTPHNY